MWGRDIDVLGSIEVLGIIDVLGSIEVLGIIDVLGILVVLEVLEGLGRNEGLRRIESGKSGVLEVFLQFFCKIFGQFKILLYFRVLNCVQTKEVEITAARKC